jgi:hypothetical protein
MQERIQRFVLWSNRLPLFRQVYAAYYRLALSFLAAAFFLNREVEAAYLRIDTDQPEWKFGLSDIDLTLIVKEQSMVRNQVFLQRFWKLYEGLRRLFPVIGEVDIFTRREFLVQSKMGAEPVQSIKSYRKLFCKLKGPHYEELQTAFVETERGITTVDHLTNALHRYAYFLLPLAIEGRNPALFDLRMAHGRAKLTKIFKRLNYSLVSQREDLSKQRSAGVQDFCYLFDQLTRYSQIHIKSRATTQVCSGASSSEDSGMPDGLLMEYFREFESEISLVRWTPPGTQEGKISVALIAQDTITPLRLEELLVRLKEFFGKVCLDEEWKTQIESDPLQYMPQVPIPFLFSRSMWQFFLEAHCLEGMAFRDSGRVLLGESVPLADFNFTTLRKAAATHLSCWRVSRPYWFRDPARSAVLLNRASVLARIYVHELGKATTDKKVDDFARSLMELETVLLKAY